VNNHDWDDSWVFDDSRFQLSGGPDDTYLIFLAEMLHPAVRPDQDETRRIVDLLNGLLAPDGWALVERSTISGRPIYGPQRLGGSRHAAEAAKHVAVVVDAEYVHCQVERMTAVIERDPELAIGTAKELIETVCSTILAKRGKPAADKPDLQPLVRRVADDLALLPDNVPESAKGAKSIRSLLGNLASIGQSLGELRNHYGTGHGKDGSSKGLSARHARLAVGAASTLATFLLETHSERTMQPSPASPE
jgi:hypothetical protein